MSDNSWQTYVDSTICAHVDCKIAIIASLQDGGVWGKKADQPEVSQQELKVIADTMKSNSRTFLTQGVYLAGEKYFTISAEENIVRGRKGSSPLSLVAAKTCMLIVVGNDGAQPGHLNIVVEDLAEHLRVNNY